MKRNTKSKIQWIFGALFVCVGMYSLHLQSIVNEQNEMLRTLQQPYVCHIRFVFEAYSFSFWLVLVQS